MQTSADFLTQLRFYGGLCLDLGCVGMSWLNSARVATDKKHKAVALAHRSASGPKRLAVVLLALSLALLLSLSVSLLAILTQARGPDGYNWIESAGNPIVPGVDRAY